MAEININQVIWHKAKIIKSDCNQVKGKMIKVSVQKTKVNLSNAIHSVKTNIWLAIIIMK